MWANPPLTRYGRHGRAAAAASREEATDTRTMFGHEKRVAPCARTPDRVQPFVSLSIRDPRRSWQRVPFDSIHDSAGSAPQTELTDQGPVPVFAA